MSSILSTKGRGKIAEHLLTVRGAIPSKKNLLRSRKGGGMYRDADIAAQIDAITWQIKPQWGRPPLSRPTLLFVLRVDANNADSDNRVTTLLDCLQAKKGAGVLVNDNTNHLRDWGVTVRQGEPGCDVYVSDEGWTPLMLRLLQGEK